MSVKIRRKFQPELDLKPMKPTPVNVSAVAPPFKIVTHELSLDRQTLTPGMARYLLDNHNGHNRPVKQTRVDQYTMELRLGKWKYNGERILFDTNGQLLSGQHRLLAIIKSGISMLCDIKFGLPTDVRDTIDTGAARSTGDVLRLVTGDADSSFKLKTLNGVKKIVNHRRTGTSAVLAQIMADDFERGLKVALATIKNRGGLGRGPAAGAVTFAAEAYPNKVKAFIEEVTEGRATTHAGHKLTAYVMGDFNKGRDREDDIASKVLFAIDAHLMGNESFDRLMTTHHEDLVEKYLTAIRANHELESLQVIRPD